MLANVSRWRIAESVRDEAAFRELIKGSLGKHVAILRDLGLLDIVVVRVSDDVMLEITIYEDDAEDRAGWTASEIAFQDDLAGKLDLIGRAAGPAFDLPRLLNNKALQT